MARSHWCTSAILAALVVSTTSLPAQVVGTSSVQFTVGTIGPYYGSSYSFGYSCGYPYGYDFWPYYYDGYGGFGLPPLFLSAESLFGPQAMQRFMGIDNRPPLVLRPADPVVVDPIQPADIDQLRAKIKVTNLETKTQARKFLGYGDDYFSTNRFHEAAQRYRTASNLAPDLPEAALREGFAAVAMKQYPAADKAFRRALMLRADWSNTSFKLDTLFPDARIKSAQFETLARLVDENPDQPTPLFVLAMELYFDSQLQRSAVFFERAAQLGANEDHLLDAILPAAGAQPAGVIPVGHPLPGAPAPGPPAPVPGPRLGGVAF